MKVRLLLIGVVLGLCLGAATLTAASAVSTGSRTNHPTPTPGVSPSPEVSPTPEDTPDSTPSPESSPTAHPCNHGFYVSQAAHAHKGGAFTSQIAKSDLGKNGDCSQPLPSPGASSSAPGPQGSAGGASSIG